MTTINQTLYNAWTAAKANADIAHHYVDTYTAPDGYREYGEWAERVMDELTNGCDIETSSAAIGIDLEKDAVEDGVHSTSDYLIYITERKDFPYLMMAWHMYAEGIGQDGSDSIGQMEDYEDLQSMEAESKGEKKNMKRTRHYKSLANLCARHSDWDFYHPSIGRVKGWNLDVYCTAHNRPITIEWNDERAFWAIVEW